MKRLLITGFEPFDGQEINPSIEILHRLKDTYDDILLTKLEVPTVFRDSIHFVWKHVQENKPNYVIMLGQAGGRKELSIERVAINLDDAAIPDNRGNKPIDTRICPHGSNAYFSTLPIKKLVDNVKKQGYPCNVSNSAGTYVCNHLMYGILHHIHKDQLPIQAGFIHVPFIPEQTKSNQAFSMPIEDLVRAIEIIIQSLKETSI
jgi:pyroglutamyl-peptidase